MPDFVIASGAKQSIDRGIGVRPGQAMDCFVACGSSQ
jgi:hypothetical protein